MKKYKVGKIIHYQNQFGVLLKAKILKIKDNNDVIVGVGKGLDYKVELIPKNSIIPKKIVKQVKKEEELWRKGKL